MKFFRRSSPSSTPPPTSASSSTSPPTPPPSEHIHNWDVRVFVGIPFRRCRGCRRCERDLVWSGSWAPFKNPRVIEDFDRYPDYGTDIEAEARDWMNLWLALARAPDRAAGFAAYEARTDRMVLDAARP